MTGDDTPASGNTRSHVTLAAQLATIISGIVVTATSLTTMVGASIGATALFVSLLVAIGYGLDLALRWL